MARIIYATNHNVQKVQMKALTQTHFGAPDVLAIADLPTPVRNFGDVLISVRAAGVNPVDALIRSGVMPVLGQPPFVLGWDVSGVVDQVEVGTTTFAVGDEVFGMPMFPRPASAYAEFVVAPAGQLAKKPKNLSHAQAAVLPMAGLTALQALAGIADVHPGQKLLIHGASGGVGHLAVQIAKILADIMFNQDLQGERAASDWNRNITNGVNRTSAIAVSSDASLAEFFSASAAESTKQASELQKRLDGYMVTPEERQLFERLGEARKAYLAARDSVSALKRGVKQRKPGSRLTRASNPLLPLSRTPSKRSCRPSERSWTTQPTRWTRPMPAPEPHW